MKRCHEDMRLIPLSDREDARLLMTGRWFNFGLAFFLLFLLEVAGVIGKGNGEDKQRKGAGVNHQPPTLGV